MANQLAIHCQSELGLLIEDNFCCHFYHSMFSPNALDYRRIQEVLKVTANQNKTILVRYGIVLLLAISKELDVLISIKH